MNTILGSFLCREITYVYIEEGDGWVDARLESIKVESCYTCYFFFTHQRKYFIQVSKTNLRSYVEFELKKKAQLKHGNKVFV